MALPQRLSRLLTHLAIGVAGVGLGALLLYVVQARRGPALEPWHTAAFDEEFSLARSGAVDDLDAYLDAEQRVFEELEQKVYARTGTGPEFRFARFSDGSLPDPRRRTPDWNRTWVLESPDPVGSVVLLHGMSDSPYSLRALGQAAHAAGYTVVGLRLPGHGTAPSGLLTATWQDMAAATDLAVASLRARAPDRPLHLIGYSTGAALALRHTLEALDAGAPVPESVVLVSPAIGVTPLAALARWNRRLSRLPGLKPLAWQNRVPEFDPYKYGSFTFNAADQVHQLTRTIKSQIEARASDGGIGSMPPVLAFLSTVDATVSADAVIDNLFEHLAPGRSELVLFDVNRNAAGATVLRSDPGPLTDRLMASQELPFDLTLIGNEDPGTNRVVARRKSATGLAVAVDSLGFEWPSGVISLSHVALPFPPDDPLYGESPTGADSLYLGRLQVQGERGLLLFPATWLVRLRHNPFFDYLEARTLGWMANPPGTGAVAP